MSLQERRTPATLGATGASNDGPPPKENSGGQSKATSTPPAETVAQKVSDKLQGDSAKAVSFLGEVQPNGPWALTAIHPDRTGTETDTFYPGEEQKMFQWIEGRNGEKNLYFHLNEVTGRITTKASKQDIKQAWWLHVDVDPRDGEDLAAEQERIRASFETLPPGVPRPTVIVQSGGGYQAYWRLQWPCLIGSDARAEEFERYNRALENTFGADNCHNVDRILRLPYTVNLPNELKRKKGRVETLASVELGYSDERKYVLGQFNQATPKQVGQASQNGRPEIHYSIEQVARIDRVESLEQWCVPDRVKLLIEHGHLRDLEGPKAGDDSRSGWLFDALCNLARCNVPSEIMFSIITDERYGISESVLDKGRKSAAYANRQVARAVDHAVDPQLCDMNEKHAVLLAEGGKTRVISYLRDPIHANRKRAVLQTFEDFQKRYMNQKIEIGKTKEGLPIKIGKGKWWLEHPQRREYAALVFEPGEHEVIGGYLNLWQGFAVEPSPGDWSLLRMHVAEVLANGDEAVCDYILRWAAWTVQNPGKQAEVALVFRGGKGTGKGTFARALMSLFGQHGLHVSNMKHVAGNFNAHLRDCCLLYADEAYVVGEKSAEAELQRLITEPTLFIEGKGKDAISAANYLHVIMTSNHDWVIPASQDERRYAVSDVSEHRKGDKAYFEALYVELENGGRAALLFDLLRYPLGDWHPRKEIPQTPALLRQKERSMSYYDRWVRDLLESGQLPGCTVQRPNYAGSEKLWEHAIANVPGLRGMTETELVQKLKNEWSCTAKSNGAKRGWVFPPLDEMRRMWEKRYKGHEWLDPTLTEWLPPPF